MIPPARPVIASEAVPLPLRQFTAIAGKANAFATMFNQVFAAGFRGPAPYRIELTAPEGPSTGGGAQALQHLRLVPVEGGPAIVVGAVNQAGMNAELKSFRNVAEVHARRFNGTQVSLDPAAYEELLRYLHPFLVGQGMKVTVTEFEGAPVVPAARSATPIVGIIVGVALAVVLGLGVIVLLMRGRAATEPQPAVRTTATP